MNKFYVTTPIYYPTAKPHLGSLYSTVLADVVARWNKLKGSNVFFLTGTDEHGQKIAQAAEKVGKTPKEFVDQFIDNYKNSWRDYEIDYSKFIRTTDESHKKGVEYWLEDLIKKGEIYKAAYEGWYCVHCETFVTEKNLIKEETPLCPSCGRPTTTIQEESYFFKLSAYQDKLLAFYKENPDFVTPKERLHEVISFVEAGLKDLSISRTTVKWGIPFPGDAKHVTYVWADALNNYITAVGYPDNKKEFDFWWPADVHILGKDILRFHAIYWPAFLMAANLPLPKKLLAHGWIKVNDQKMSKSFGNVIDPQDLLKIYGADPVRYYLVSQLSIAQDSNFSTQDLEDKINADLANNLGNLLNRTMQLADKYNSTVVPAVADWSDESIKLFDASKVMIQEFTGFMDAYSFHMAISCVVQYISRVNAYFHAHEPWKIAKHDHQKFIEIISAVVHSLETAAVLLWPVMPAKMAQLLATLSISFDIRVNNVDAVLKNPWNKSYTIIKGPILFEKIEPSVAGQPLGIEESQQQKAGQSAQQSSTVEDNFISIDDFAKVELLVGTIMACEPVEGSDKLLKMQVDFGPKGMRQILGGVKKHFSPDYLINRQAVFVTNFKPRKMMGLESQGMMLSVEAEDGSFKLVAIDGIVPNGAKLK